MLSIQIIPLTQSEAIPTNSTNVALTGVAIDERSDIVSLGITSNQYQDLVVYPGDRADMEIILTNTVNQEIILNDIEVRGNFPADWVQISSEGDRLNGNEKMSMGLYFLVPSDFFEQQELPLDAQGRPTLNINYQCQINVFYQQINSSNQKKETIFFNLYVRPHSLYPKFLPEIYREIDFIGRFLNIFEQTFEPAVAILQSMYAYLDPITAPKALLPFLAHWVGWESIPGLDLENQRHLIRNAIKIYQTRGTKEGLRYYLHLYTNLPLDENLQESDKHISIEEPHGKGFVLGESHLGRDTVLGSGRSFHFIVRIRANSNSPLPLNEQLIRVIIEQQKPAWTTYELYV